MECKIITGGFSFCGTDIKTLGLEYAPEKENTYVYSPAETAIYEETFDGHNGGYLYGAAKKPKEFTLRCFFENEHIARGMMARVHQVFRPGRSGKLIFKRRPWCYYYATVSEVPFLELSNYLNGLITIHMKAYYPFARSEQLKPDDVLSPFYNDLTDMCHGEIMLNTGLFEKREWVPPMAFTNLTEETPIILSNPGTERASVGIIAAGDAIDGLIIENKTTGQTCKLVALSKGETSNVNKHVYVDGLSGKTILTDEEGRDKKLSFLYHDSGFIELEPCVPVIRQVYTYHSGTTVAMVNLVTEDVVGKYIYASKKWHKIIEQPDESTVIVDSDTGPEGYDMSMIAPMNELVVRPVSTMDITRLSFVYVPTFA